MFVRARVALWRTKGNQKINQIRTDENQKQQESTSKPVLYVQLEFNINTKEITKKRYYITSQVIYVYEDGVRN